MKPHTKCCENMSFRRLDDGPVDLGTVDAVELTLGACGSCKNYVIHGWVAGGERSGAVQTPRGLAAPQT